MHGLTGSDQGSRREAGPLRQLLTAEQTKVLMRVFMETGVELYVAAHDRTLCCSRSAMSWLSRTVIDAGRMTSISTMYRAPKWYALTCSRTSGVP